MEAILGPLCDLRLAVSGPQAIDCASAEHFDAIFMDIDPDEGMNGREAAERIRAPANCEEVPVAVIAADVMRARCSEFLARGCAHYLAKPFTRQTLPHELTTTLVSHNPG